jgi:hypothetical protein
MGLNYYDTLIAVADDCPVSGSVVPVARGGRKTVAVLQYEMIADPALRLTQEDVVFESWLRRQPDAEALAEDERAALREEFFAKPQACMRTSPLPKKYGFGLLCDAEGVVSLCPVESEAYRQAMESGDVKVVKAMRSSRR